MIPEIVRRGDHALRVEPDVAIVALAWLDREVGSRRCANVARALASVAECEALRQLRGALQAAIGGIDPAAGHSMLSAARERLTPVETALVIEPAGSEDLSPPPEAAPDAAPGQAPRETEIVAILPAPSMLVLFEFLCREVDDRDGRDLLASFVSPAEYWALTSMQCHLEPGAFYAVDRDYGVQLAEARDWLRSSLADDDAGIIPAQNDHR